MDAFLNLGLFLVAFYLILLYAGHPSRRNRPATRDIEVSSEQKRVA